MTGNTRMARIPFLSPPGVECRIGYHLRADGTWRCGCPVRESRLQYCQQRGRRGMVAGAFSIIP